MRATVSVADLFLAMEHLLFISELVKARRGGLKAYLGALKVYGMQKSGERITPHVRTYLSPT